MRQVELHSKKYPGLFALVDDGDFELVSGYRWHAHKPKRHRTFYAQASVKVDGKWTRILLHRLVMGFPASQVDHVNRNGLDCRKSNLRFATGAQNEANKPKLERQCSSKYKGVHWAKNDGKWRVSIRIDGRKRSLGYFADEVEAAKAYDRAALAQWGEFALINFPVATVNVQLVLPLAA